MRKCMYISLLVVLALISLIGAPLSVASSTMEEASEEWQIPVPLVPELAVSWFPEIHADSDGAVRVVWDSDRPGEYKESEQNQIMLAQFKDGQWSAPSSLLVK